MFVEEPRAFLESAKPLIYFNCFTGMGAYRYPNLSETKFLCMELYTIVFTLANWTIIYIGLSGLRDDAFDRHNPTNSRMLFLVIAVVNSGIAVATPFLKWLRRKELKACLRQLPILDEGFQDILGPPIDYRKQYNRHTLQVIGIVLATAVISISDIPWSMLSGDSEWVRFAIIFTLHYPIMVILVLDANFCTLVGFLEKKFRDLNGGLLRLAEHETEQPSASYHGNKIFAIPGEVKVTPGCRIKDTKAQGLINDKRYSLHKIRKAHLELCKLSQNINDAFGIENLLSMGFSFILITSMLFTVYCFIVTENFTNQIWLLVLIPCMIWTLIYAFNMWIVNHLCWRASNEAERTGDVIYELLETRVDKELQDEIQEFAVQILQNSVRFNACGFFTLDHTFVQGMIGSITTYLVILIQMSPISKTFVSNDVLAWNGTEVSANQ